MPGTSPTATNIHASAVVVGDRGIVIAGPSGSGKTQLALALICAAREAGLFGRLVADDQLFLTARNGRLVASAPQSIAGLAEVRGIGPTKLAHIDRAPADLMVRLVDRGSAERLPERKTQTLLGCALPLLELAVQDRRMAVLAVLAALSLPPFDRA